MTYKKIATFFVSVCFCLTSAIGLSSCNSSSSSNGNEIINGTSDGETEKPLSENDTNLIEVIDDGDYTYAIFDKHVEVLSYLGSDTNVEIPSKYDGKPVTKLGDFSFSLTYLESVVVPSTVEEIGENCFSPLNNKPFKTDKDTYLNTLGHGAMLSIENPNYKDFTSPLKEISLPNGLISIGAGAFSCCTALEKINLPDSVQAIGSAAFFNCISLKGEIIFPKSLCEISSSAFSNCTSITKFVINSSLQELPSWLFENCTSLESIEIPDNISLLGQYCFAGCISLRDLTLPSEILWVPSHCFENCTSLEEVILPDSICGIESSAFKGCSSLKTISIPSTIDVIERAAFEGTPWLETAPDTINDIPIKST